MARFPSSSRCFSAPLPMSVAFLPSVHALTAPRLNRAPWFLYVLPPYTRRCARITSRLGFPEHTVLASFRQATPRKIQGQVWDTIGKYWVDGALGAHLNCAAQGL